MNLLDRYFIKKFLSALTYCLSVILCLYMIIDLFGHLDEILREHIGIEIMLKYYLHSAPGILVQVAPSAVLLAVMYLLAVSGRYNEIIAIRASGISPWRFGAPLFICGAAISACVFLLNETLVPQSSAVADLIREETINKNAPERRLTKLALFGQNNRMFYVEEFDVKDKTLKGLIILQHDDQHRVIGKLSAQEMLWANGIWKARAGVSYKLNAAGDIVDEPITFEEKILDIAERPQDFIKDESRADLMNYRQLKAYIDKFGPGAEGTIKRLYVDLHYKIAYPMMNFFILIVGVAFGLRNYRGRLLSELGLAFVIGFFYYVVISISLALGKGDILSPFLSAHLANLTFGALSLRLLAKAG